MKMNITTYKLTNKNGMTITVTNLGCAIINLEIPSKNGKTCDIVLGLNSAEDYATKDHPYFGVIAGRVANRINSGKFTLEGKNYTLETNDGIHHLHGGINGFSKKVWNVDEANNNNIVFSYNSPDGDSMYPGNLNTRVTYTLTDENVLRIDYYSTTDTKTICNLTNHSYFNLNGHADGNIFDHEMEIISDKITTVDENLIPTGELADVTGTAFDFRTAKEIGKDFKAIGGYDHNYALRQPGKAASVYAPKTGIRLTVYTNSPGMQLYTSNMMPDEGIPGKGVTYHKYSAFCLETQIFPDAINQPNFPSCVVTKDKPQQFYTEFKFEW